MKEPMLHPKKVAEMLSVTTQTYFRTKHRCADSRTEDCKMPEDCGGLFFRSYELQIYKKHGIS